MGATSDGDGHDGERFENETLVVTHRGLQTVVEGLSGVRLPDGEILFDPESAARYGAAGDALVRQARRRARRESAEPPTIDGTSGGPAMRPTPPKDGERGPASAGTVRRLDVAQRRREKAAARDEDAEDLRTGRKSAAELTDENSMFPRGLLKKARVIFPEQE